MLPRPNGLRVPDHERSFLFQRPNDIWKKAILGDVKGADHISSAGYVQAK
jgi:hypothetical protein